MSSLSPLHLDVKMIVQKLYYPLKFIIDNVQM